MTNIDYIKILKPKKKFNLSKLMVMKISLVSA